MSRERETIEPDVAEEFASAFVISGSPDAQISDPLTSKLVLRVQSLEPLELVSKDASTRICDIVEACEVVPSLSSRPLVVAVVGCTAILGAEEHSLPAFRDGAMHVTAFAPLMDGLSGEVGAAIREGRIAPAASVPM